MSVALKCLDALVGRMAHMRQRPGFSSGLFRYDRNGLRLAIASAEDEVRELREAWAEGKRRLNDGEVKDRIRHELLDVAGVAMLALEELEESRG